MTKTDAIKAEYAPYNTFPEFQEGFDDWTAGKAYDSKYRGVAAQAYDRGCEAAVRVIQAERTS